MALSTASDLQAKIASAQSTLSSNQATLASLQSQYDAKMAAANAPGNSLVRNNLLQDAADLQDDITNANSIISQQQAAISDLQSQLASLNPSADTAQASVDNQNPSAAQTAAADTSNQLTTEEQVNLTAPNYNAVQQGGYDPNSDYYTGGGYVAPLSTSSEPSIVGTDYNIAPNFNQTGGIQTEPSGGGATPSATNPDSTAASKAPIMNPLHAYPSYTYGLSLALMTIDEYNQIVKTQTYTPKRVIIASAGRYNNTQDATDPNQFIRAPYFAEDFYFESLNIETIIGLNEHSRATNAIKTTFTIIEPYGMTLVDRIIKLCSSPDVKARNYVEQPYMLQIDFFAIDDTGTIIGSIPNQVKRIPIRILSMNIKASSKGAEYQIEACPYNHSAFDVSTLATPAHFEIVAGTVASFFQSTESESYLAEAKSERETAANGYNIDANGNKINPDGTISPVPLTTVPQKVANVISSDPVYRVKSYGSAYNAWFDDMVKTKKIKVADTIYFKFAPEIQSAKFLLGKNLSAKDTPMADASNEISMRAGNADSVNAALDYSTQIFSINTGTSIDMVINYVIRNSDYIQNQLVVPEDFGSDAAGYKAAKLKNANLPLKWFKIVPQVTLTGYDTIRKVWAREITYNVVTYDVYNTKIAAAPQGTWTTPLKEYNYYYTGKNLDVLDFNLEFNALYYTAVTAYKKNMAATYGLDIYDDQELNPDNYNGIDDTANAVQPMKEKPQTVDAKARATGGDITPKAAAAVDTQESLYTAAGGDMLQGTLKIIGDPQYIKQDDTFYAPVNVINPLTGSASTAVPSSDDRLIADGSLHMDQQEVYIQVKFLMPSDIDDSTGLMKFDSDFQQSSMFSGMFRVLKVDSTFSGGKFEQSLDIVRLPRQSTLDYVADKQTTQRSESGTTVNTTNVDVAPPTTTSPTTKTTGDNVAPNNTPVADNPQPTASAAQQDLAIVDSTASTQAITSPSSADAAPQATVSPADTGPSATKLALQQQLADLQAANAPLHQQTDAANAAIETATNDIDRQQARIDRYSAVQPSDPGYATAQTNLAAAQALLATAQQQKDSATATFLSLQQQNFQAYQAEKALQNQISTAA